MGDSKTFGIPEAKGLNDENTFLYSSHVTLPSPPPPTMPVFFFYHQNSNAQSAHQFGITSYLNI